MKTLDKLIKSMPKEKDIYGNGAAYAIKCLNSGDELFVQGDDALQIESDTQDFQYLDILSDYFS